MSLTDFVIMPGTDYQNICNAIRAKSGSTKVLKSGEIAAAIQSIADAMHTDLGEKLYSFGAISDIHINDGDGNDALRRAILALQNEGVEFICTAGDICTSASVPELQKYQTIVNEAAVVPIYSCTGNHDRGLTNENWKTYVGHALNYVFEYQNDVFIFLPLATESSITPSGDTPYGEDNLQWLREQLDLYKGRRIFVFTHFPLSGYSGLRTGQYYGFTSASAEDDSILSAMNSTKNVMHFSGHTHFLFEVEESYDNINVIQMNFNDCATVHIPSSNLPRDASNTYQEELSQGYMVNVYENAVVLKPVDFVAGSYISGYEYILPIKNNAVEVGNSLVVSDESMLVDEGTAAVFTVRLLQAIEENVVVNLSCDNACISLGRDTLTFTPENYNAEQIVTVNAEDDEVSVDMFSVITVSAEGMDPKTISVTVVNDETGDGEAKLVSISAVYSGGSVAQGTPVNRLSGITVTGTYDDGSTVSITDYTMTPEIIEEGVNTITVSYEGMTATFTVTGTALSGNLIPAAIESDYTPFNGGNGYVADYGIDSQGKLVSAAGTDATGFMPCQSGDMIYTGGIGDAMASVYGRVAFYNSDFELLASVAYTNLTVTAKKCRFNKFEIPILISVDDVSGLSGDTLASVAYFRLSAPGISGASVITVDEPLESENSAPALTWVEGYIDSNGGISSSNTAYHTEPFSVEGMVDFALYGITHGNSNMYVFFYSADEISSNAMVQRVTLTANAVTTVTVPDGATHAVLRSNSGGSAFSAMTATLEKMDDYMYFVF
ncbi:MAG: metallophosphoesterase [Oscillospiraceae bacterium]|nr:metallophosphoesterase [Oscillospiraceae bacterium]